MAKVAIAEIKAHCKNPEEFEELLYANGASFVGEDHQVDTYFTTAQGRAKLRQGNVENTLIFYDRHECQGIKNSQVEFVKLDPVQVDPLKAILSQLSPVLIVVDKHRKIFFIDNVKFHIDRVEGLGSFLEIEAIGTKQQNFQELVEQCDTYQKKFEINQTDCIAQSYCDMLMKLNN